MSLGYESYDWSRPTRIQSNLLVRFVLVSQTQPWLESS